MYAIENYYSKEKREKKNKARGELIALLFLGAVILL